MGGADVGVGVRGLGAPAGGVVALAVRGLVVVGVGLVVAGHLHQLGPREREELQEWGWLMGDCHRTLPCMNTDKNIHTHTHT